MISRMESKFLRIFIEKEAKFASYKFALLRGIIELIDEYDHLKIETNSEIEFPLGLLIEKWIFYYFPLMENNIPQIYGKKDIVFKKEIKKFIDEYKYKGGFLQFYNDYRHSKIDLKDIKPLFNKIKRAIYEGPMKYLGYSLNRDYYTIFDYKKSSKKKIKNSKSNLREYLISNYGYIVFDRNFYILLKEIGSFINGTESLIFKWAKFSIGINGSLNEEKVISLLLKNTEVEREVHSVKRVYDNHINSLKCVWSDRKLEQKNYEVDHALPFSITFINDMWNLLPTYSEINRKKKDKIPCPELIYRKKENIKRSWCLIFKEYKEMFIKEMEIGLIGPKISKSNIDTLFNEGINKLAEKSKFLIEKGYEEWNLNL